MTSSSKAHAVRNVPPPSDNKAGTKTGSKTGNAYARFIPREELASFEAWRPGNIDGAGDAPARDTTQAPPAFRSSAGPVRSGLSHSA